MLTYQKEHPKTNINTALDSLNLEKTFSNKFWYSRTKLLNNFLHEKETSKKLIKQLLSYSSIALFILLPFFSLFLKLLYIRRKFNYVAHLVFVFHTQTVFFLLFSIFYIINFIKNVENILTIFILLFMLYLFIAMKKFYGQGYLKTFFKYLLANSFFMFITFIGTIIISGIAFALY
jgi:hypothetical protein